MSHKRSHLVLMLAGALLACSRDDRDGDEPTEYQYLLYTSGLEPQAGVSVLVGRQALKLTDKVLIVPLPLDSPLVLQGVAAELPTPCGPKRVALTVHKHVEGEVVTADVERELRKANGSRVVSADLRPAAELPRSVAVYADLSAGPAKLGALTLAHGHNRVVDPQCAPGLQVELASGAGGASAAFVLGPKDVAVLVTDRKERCYQLRAAVYGDASGIPPHEPLVVRDAHVHGLYTAVDHFLEAAPKTIETHRSHIVEFRHELTTIECR